MTAPVRVTEIERITLNVPIRPRIKPWNDLLVWQWGIVEVTRVVTDAGFVGYGETLPHYTWGRVSDDAVARVKGQNAADFLGDDSLGAGLQMAIYDVVGQALGVPLYQLLGQPKVREWCPIAWWNTKAPPEVLAEEARDALAEGYVAHKFKTRPWFDVYEQVAAVAAVTPPHYRLDLDWNGLLVNAGNALPVLKELDKHPQVAIYESPLPHEDVEGYRKLRAQSSHPLAIHFGTPPFHVAVREEMCDGFVVHNGIVSVMNKGTLAAAFNKPFWLQIVGPGLTTALCAHFGAVLTHAQWPAITCVNIYSDHLLAEPLTIEGGHVRVPEKPGLGVTINEQALEKYRMAPPYELPEPRHLLSVVWPGGRVVHYTRMSQCWDDFKLGHLPAQERGVRLDVTHDDSTPEWRDLYERASQRPVYDVR
ncbi:MAG: mandelate racemase/muconate lactonizing enzyme family protein [Thermomicrobiales bacterium]